jgi:hypothetical protein
MIPGLKNIMLRYTFIVVIMLVLFDLTYCIPKDTVSPKAAKQPALSTNRQSP